MRKKSIGLALLLTAGIASAADFSGWQKKMAITFSGYDKTETLTNFPALVVLGTNISSFLYSDFLSGTNADLRFTDATQTNELNYEIEGWDTNGNSHIWVQVPRLTGSAVIYAFLGRSGQSIPAYTTNGATWSEGFKSVYHFRQTNSAPDLRDSTVNAYHGLNSNTTSTAAGRIGYAETFPGVNQFIGLTNANRYLPAINSPITLSAWFKAAEIPVAALDDRIVTLARYSGSSGLSVGLGSTNKLQLFRANASGVGTTTDFATISSNTWHHMTISFNGSQFACYLNGSLLTNITDSLTNNDPSVKAYIGGGPAGNGANPFNGIIDEFAISSVARSSNWVWACFMNQSSNGVFTGSFNTYGEVKWGDIPWISNGGIQNQTDTSSDVAGTLSSTGTLATTVYLYWSTVDGTTNASAWTTGGSVSNLGVTAPGSFTNTLSGLTPNTTYYWNYSAVNESGTVWGATAGSPSFKTYGPPAVNNGAGATDVYQPFNATLNGNLLSGTTARVFILMGTSDGVWTVTNDLLTLSEGPFSKSVGGLTANTPYFYTCYATNDYGSSLATPSAAFTTRQGTVYYWVGTASTNWSAAANWSATSGGAGGAGVPGPWDDVIFDAGGTRNAVVDAAFTDRVYSVTIDTGYIGTNTQFRNLSVARNYQILRGAWRFLAGTAAALNVGNDMFVSNATIFCERVSTAVQGTGRVFNVGGSLTIATNGAFNSDGLGFDSRLGPGGAGNGIYSESGGSHGGEGGGTYWSTSQKPKLPYGSITAPISLGSGGDDTVAKGGGAIALFVTNNVTIQAGGRIRANGIGGTYFAGAAGGSIYIRCRNLAGAGLILADGGDTTGNGGGSGGRIAVILSVGAGVDQIACHAYGGLGGNGYYGHGAAGTVYIQTAAQADGAGMLVLDNGNRRSNYPKTLMRSGEDWSGFAAVVITNQADVGVYTNVNLSAVKFAGRGAAASFISVRAPGVGIVYPSDWTISNFTLIADVPLALTGTVTVATNGVITHSPHANDTPIFKVDISVWGDLVVLGQIHADNRGYPGAPGGQTQGRGLAPANYRSGASHGGDRAVAAGNTDPIVGGPYGSVTNPTTLGSGGNSLPGGGAIRITTTGTLTVASSAVISSCGSVPYEYGGTGAGGSIWITAGTFAGSGTVKANGGTGGSASADGNGLCGGSGGRIAIESASGNFGAISFQAYGGYQKDTYDGGAGTVYLRGAQGEGRLIIDNANYNTAVRTLITSNVTGAVVGDVVMRAGGNVTLSTNATLTVCGSWTNDGTCAFRALTNSTVAFAGTNTAAVYRPNTFFNLTATNSDRTLRFEAGRTNVVMGALRLDKVTLNSTVDGSWTYLVQSNGALQDIRRVIVRDSNATGGQKMIAGPRSQNLGHNVNWQFPPAGTILLIY